MSEQPFLSPVQDSVPKVGQVAVGEDLDFQRKWWRFERLIWIVFLVVLIADVLGLFGRGWLAKTQVTDTANKLTLDYERIERAGTPSIMTLHFGPGTIQNGKVVVFVSQDVVKALGAQRISPQPGISVLGNGGITYTFYATQTPATAEIALSPSFPGVHHFQMQVAGGQPLMGRVVVMP
jgi:hypothetical protein